MDTILGITIRKIADTIFAQAITVSTTDKTTNRIRFQNVYYSPSLYGMDDVSKKVLRRRPKNSRASRCPQDRASPGR